jgi:hypothetical protein
MRVVRYLLPVLLLVGVLVTSVGWYRSAHTSTVQHFDTCSFDGTTRVLTYSYGANQMVSPRVDTRGRDVIVALETTVGDGPTPAIGLSGQARFATFGGQQTVRYPDGERLDCPPHNERNQ